MDEDNLEKLSAEMEKLFEEEKRTPEELQKLADLLITEDTSLATALLNTFIKNLAKHHPELEKYIDSEAYLGLTMTMCQTKALQRLYIEKE
tara:strand:- start:4368 stop:4640 length:273 start_codon:yes stop_codon:yes gene_type:complete